MRSKVIIYCAVALCFEFVASLPYSIDLQRYSGFKAENRAGLAVEPSVRPNPPRPYQYSNQRYDPAAYRNPTQQVQEQQLPKVNRDNYFSRNQQRYLPKSPPQPVEVVNEKYVQQNTPNEFVNRQIYERRPIEVQPNNRDSPSQIGPQIISEPYVPAIPSIPAVPPRTAYSSGAQTQEIEIPVIKPPSPKVEYVPQPNNFDRLLARASNPVEQIPEPRKPQRPLIDIYLSHPKIKEVLSNTRHKKRYLVIHPDGTVEHVDKLETIAEKHPNYFLVNAGDIVTSPKKPATPAPIVPSPYLAQPQPIPESERKPLVATPNAVAANGPVEKPATPFNAVVDAPIDKSATTNNAVVDAPTEKLASVEQKVPKEEPKQVLVEPADVTKVPKTVPKLLPILPVEIAENNPSTVEVEAKVQEPPTIPHPVIPDEVTKTEFITTSTNELPVINIVETGTPLENEATTVAPALVAVTTDKPVEISATDKPVESAAPEKPVESAAPDKPVEAAAPEKPVESAAPEKPIESAASEKPVESDAPEKPVESAASEKPVESAAPEKTIESAAPEKPVESAAPEKPIESAAPEKPVESAAPEKPVESDAPEKPVELSVTEKLLKPSDTEPISVESTPSAVAEASIVGQIKPITESSEPKDSSVNPVEGESPLPYTESPKQQDDGIVHPTLPEASDKTQEKPTPQDPVQSATIAPATEKDDGNSTPKTPCDNEAPKNDTAIIEPEIEPQNHVLSKIDEYIVEEAGKNTPLPEVVIPKFGDLDVSKLPHKPVVWFRTSEPNFWDKLVAKDKGLDVVYFFQIHNQPKIEKDVKTTIHTNGTVVEDVIETIWEFEGDEPTVTKTTKITHPDDL